MQFLMIRPVKRYAILFRAKIRRVTIENCIQRVIFTQDFLVAPVLHGNVLQDPRTSGDLMLESIPITVERGKLCSQSVVAEIMKQKEHRRPPCVRWDGALHQLRTDLLRLCRRETDLRQLQLFRQILSGKIFIFQSAEHGLKFLTGILHIF